MRFSIQSIKQLYGIHIVYIYTHLYILLFIYQYRKLSDSFEQMFPTFLTYPCQTFGKPELRFNPLEVTRCVWVIPSNLAFSTKNNFDFMCSLIFS